jgi:YqaJ-like viral recombinase domain
MTILDIPQRSDAWREARLGRLCGSRASDMLATLKGGTEAAARRDLRVALCLERITGVSQENGYINADMQRGMDQEPAALAAYEAKTGTFVEPVGFCLHDALLAGCSPDGFCGDDGLVEVKCPRSANHLAYLRAGTVPKEHLPQLVHALWITGRRWCDFVSYDDRWPEPLRLFVVRYHRDDLELSTYETVVRKFLDEVDAEVEAVRALMAPVVTV